MNIITALLSRVIGLPEPTLRLLSTILLAYPSAFYYKKLYLSQDSLKSTREDRNQYILFAGLALSFFFNGFHIYHSLVTTAVSYGLCFILGEQMNDRKLALMTVWGFNALYLLVGYYYMQTDDYDITWTMSQCILCLRMMGFGFDYYDGRKKFTVAGAPTEKQADKNEDHTQAAIRSTEKAKPPVVLPLSFRADTPLTDLPDLKEVFAYAHFPAAFLVGPQFSFSLYRKWLNDDERQLNAEEHEEKERAQIAYIIRCVLLAAVYLGLQQTIGTRYNTSYLLTDEYRSLCLLKRAFVFVVAGKFAYNKYIGTIAAFGISYEGFDMTGLAQFRGLANTLPGTFETATSIDHIIGSFNINTNLWSKYYVFKRLKFLGSKLASQFGTLAFLAIWHGFHWMYFLTFFLEFLFVLCESILRRRLLPHVQPYTKQNEIYFYLWKLVAWAACQATCAYGIVGFELLKVGRAWAAYKSVGFIGHIVIAVIISADKYLPKNLGAPKMKKK
ncbi:MBOAT-domain-containing protein [Rhizopus microsporus var. microsporus]|uniref:Lysophospholipid acyltransferase 5 n=1 Tax=Rhizopus microsporus var. microsporus TaxID=86635 RepID=A0A1X0RHY4_RHIZD|nr:MBOAT-domain-containing protein [Rhizopus microsporus var. microsporus]